MRTCKLLLSIILWASTAAGQPISPDDPIFGDPGGPYVGGGQAEPLPVSPDPDPFDWELLDWVVEPLILTPDLPGFEITHVPWSDVSSVKEGISQLSVKPSFPTSSDEVSVTITGWKPNSELAVERTTLRVEGNEIWLDLYWHTRPLLPPPPTFLSPSAGPSPGGSGITEGQNWTLGLSATVTLYDVTPAYEGVPFEYTERLGTFSWGTYILHVTNQSPMTGSASTSFTVLPSTSPSAQVPWWRLAPHITP